MKEVSKKTSIVCFGEVLWDMLPTGKIPGGAPMNVAFHTKNFGMDAQIISAVGNDDLGKELLDFLQQKNIDTRFIHINDTYSTSTVQVTLNEKGSASYEIVQPVAWDFLSIDKPIEKVVANADFLLYGSLIGRSNHNVAHLLQLIDIAQTKVFDVNLRSPFYTQSFIETLLQKSNIVKMNDEELDIIVNWHEVKGDLKGQMVFLMKHFQIETLIMTKGKHGAYCMHKGELFEQKGFSVEVKDTVGSGDSFLAAFLYKLSMGSTWQQCLEFACATGAIVASRSGGTPIISESIVKAFITSS